jgi:hypothetical protein
MSATISEVLKTWAEVMSTGKKEFKCRKLEVEFKQGEM